MKHPTPNKPGHFWAKWQIASEATRDGDELTPSPNFEVVQVFENSTDGNDPEHLLVYVPGVEACQALDAFFWGPEVAPLIALNRETPGAGGETRKAHYGPGVQPWDHAMTAGWGPSAAAFMVLRYLRRDKMAEHSLESARWYYARLVEGVAKKRPLEESAVASDWQGALDRLELILTQAERALARGGN